MNKARAGSPIWPVGCRVAEPMSSQEVAVRCGIVRAYRCLGVDDVAIERLRPGTLATFADDQRTRGIALAHERARARKRRFIAWLRTVGDISHGVALRHAYGSLSPEHAAEQAAADGFHWPFMATGWGVELRRDAVRPEWAALAADLVRSPEWASLPWQRDPSEVSRG